MLGKLLKYDLKWIYKVVVIFYVLALIFSIIGRALSNIENSLVFSIVGSIFNGIAIGMMISSLINCLMRAWARFTRNIYKDESYLTHTLPIKKETIYLSKVLAAIICVFTTILMILLCLAISYYSQTNIDLLKATLETTATIYNTSIIKLVLIVFTVFSLEIIFVILLGYLGLILGHKFSDNKMVKSIIIGFVLYLLTQAVTLGLVYILGLFNADVMNLISTANVVSIGAIKIIMYCGIGVYVIYIFVCYVIGLMKFKKGVNVD